MYSNLVERCFTSCCNDFTSKALSSKEVRSSSISPLNLRTARAQQSRTDDLSLGAMRDELHRQVPEALGAGGSSVCRTERRYVCYASCESDQNTDTEAVSLLQRPWVPVANEHPAAWITSHAEVFILPYSVRLIQSHCLHVPSPPASLSTHIRSHEIEMQSPLNPVNHGFGTGGDNITWV